MVAGIRRAPPWCCPDAGRGLRSATEQLGVAPNLRRQLRAARVSRRWHGGTRTTSLLDLGAFDLLKEVAGDLEATPIDWSRDGDGERAPLVVATLWGVEHRDVSRVSVGGACRYFVSQNRGELMARCELDQVPRAGNRHKVDAGGIEGRK